MERYFRVARRCVVKRPRVQELTQEQFDNCLWSGANQEVWEEKWDTEDDTFDIYDIVDNLTEELASAYSFASHTVWEKDEDEQVKLISGGVDLGDYTYYTVTDDYVTSYDLPINN